MKDSNKKLNRPIIEFGGKKYIFSLKSIIIFAIGTPISAYLIYLFFDLEINFWLHEIVVKQTVLFLNLLFDMGASTNYAPFEKYPWEFVVPGRDPIGFETFCTGVQAICVFAGIIIFTPHSKDKTTNEDIIWRKAKALIVSSVIFYVVNIIRMLIQIYLYYIGYDWDDIHVSISAASSFIAAIIVLLLHKWIPEFILSIIYTGTLISQWIKKVRGISTESKENIELKSKK
ncbi:MAG: archaeosortase H [Promethearchaeota archaeon]